MRLFKLACAAAVAANALIAAPAVAAPVAASSNVDGKALILVPLTLTKIRDLDFGTVIPSSTPGTVAINAATGVRSVTGGVVAVPSDAGSSARFAGAGTPDQQVLVAISPPTELASAAGETIAVGGMTLDGAPMRTIDATTRTFFVNVGGTLNIAPNQPEGDYSAEFWVTAVYQ
ncbi:MAG TPA: DUF4402 domain-containing protein [Sphingomicrobium sp.]|nr:DUF4402 domain-containing protein [Sphingomicrobium sp.]